jgi:hypothetical protein
MSSMRRSCEDQVAVWVTHSGEWRSNSTVPVSIAVHVKIRRGFCDSTKALHREQIPARPRIEAGIARAKARAAVADGITISGQPPAPRRMWIAVCRALKTFPSTLNMRALQYVVPYSSTRIEYDVHPIIARVVTLGRELAAAVEVHAIGARAVGDPVQWRVV